MLQPAPIADSAAEISAWWRIVELCFPSHEECGAVTFAPSGAETLEKNWRAWLSDLFVPVIRPSLAALQSAAAAQDFPRLLAEDAALGESLPSCCAKRSRIAGRHLLLSYAPPQGAKLLERLRDEAARNPSVAHLSTVFALRGQVFHLPFVQVEGALILAECVIGADDAGVTLPAGRTAALLQRAMETMAAAPASRLLAV